MGSTDGNGSRVGPAPMIQPTFRHLEAPGRLFIVEGIDGSGKSTQLTLLAQWLRAEGYPVIFSEWNSSSIVRATTHYNEPQVVAECSEALGEAMRGIDVSKLDPKELLQTRGW